MEENVRLEKSGKVWSLTLDRPAKKNALTVAMYAALGDTLSAAAADETVSVVTLTGAGDAFSAGNDIADFVQRATGGGDGSPLAGPTFLQALSTFPKPLLAGVNGLAVGIG